MAEDRPAADRPLHLGRSVDVDAEALAAAQADRDPAGGSQRQGAAGVADRRVGEILAGLDRNPALVLREAVFEQFEVVAVAGFVGRRPDRDRDQVHPLAAAGADQDVAGVEGVAGLDPGRPGSVQQQLVDRRDPPRRPQAAQGGASRVGDPGEGGDPQQALAQGRQVAGAGEVAALVEPDRVGVVGVGEAEGGGAAIHLGDEAGDRAGGGEGEVVGRVVAAAQDQAVEQVPHADPLPGPQPQQRLAVDRVVGSGAHDLVERQLPQRHVGGHQLGGAGDRQPLGSRVGGEHGAGAGVDQGPGLGQGPRSRRRPGDPGQQAAQRQKRREQRGAGPAPAHRSFSV